MKKALIIVAGLAVLVLIGWASLRDVGPKGEEVEVQPVSIRTISARVKGTGEIAPEKKVEISAKVIGEIINLPVKEGQEVHQGQLLVEIERDVYEAARDRARAALLQAQVAVERQQVQLVDAERNLERARELHGGGLNSQQALDTAQLAVDTAKVEVEAAKAAVEQSRSALDQAEDDLARTTIRSPMDGIVIQLDAEKGETVVPGSTNLPGSVIMTVADMSRLRAEVEVSEVDVVQLAIGQKAVVNVDALADRPQQGHVVEIATSGRKDATQGTIRFAVKIALDDPDPALRPAMTAKVDILTATRKDALTVPIQAVVKRTLSADGKEVRGVAAKGLEESDVVYLIEDGKAVVRKVETGISDELYVEITSGLTQGEEVVVGPYRTLKALHDGDPISIAKKPADEGSEDGEGDVQVRVS